MKMFRPPRWSCFPWLLLLRFPSTASAGNAANAAKPPVDAEFDIQEVLGSGQGSDVYRVVKRKKHKHKHIHDHEKIDPVGRGVEVLGPPPPHPPPPPPSPPPVEVLDPIAVDDHNVQDVEVQHSREQEVEVDVEERDAPSTPDDEPQEDEQLALKFFEPRRWLESDIAMGKLEHVDQSAVRQFFKWGRSGIRHFLTGLELLPDGMVEFIVSLWTLETVCAFLKWLLGLPSGTTVIELLALARGEQLPVNFNTASEQQQEQPVVQEVGANLVGELFENVMQNAAQGTNLIQGAAEQLALGAVNQWAAQPLHYDAPHGEGSSGGAAGTRVHHGNGAFPIHEAEQLAGLQGNMNVAAGRDEGNTVVDPNVVDFYHERGPTQLPVTGENTSGTTTPRSGRSSENESELQGRQPVAPREDEKEINRHSTSPHSISVAAPQAAAADEPPSATARTRSSTTPRRPTRHDPELVVPSVSFATRNKTQHLLEPGGDDPQGVVRVEVPQATQRDAEKQESEENEFFFSPPKSAIMLPQDVDGLFGGLPQKDSLNLFPAANIQKSAMYSSGGVNDTMSGVSCDEQAGMCMEIPRSNAFFGNGGNNGVAGLWGFTNAMQNAQPPGGGQQMNHGSSAAGSGTSASRQTSAHGGTNAGTTEENALELLKSFAIRLLKDERGETEVSDEMREQYQRIREHIVQTYLPTLRRECQLMFQAHNAWEQKVAAGFFPKGQFELKNPFPNCHVDQSQLTLPATTQELLQMQNEYAKQQQDLSRDEHGSSSLTSSGATGQHFADPVLDFFQNKLKKGFYMVLDYVSDSIPLDAVPHLLQKDLFPTLYETYLLSAFSNFHPYPEVTALQQMRDNIEAQVTSYLYSRVFARLQNALLFLHADLHLVHNDVQGGNILLQKSKLVEGIRALYEDVANVVTLEGKLSYASGGIGNELENQNQENFKSKNAWGADTFAYQKEQAYIVDQLGDRFGLHINGAASGAGSGSSLFSSTRGSASKEELSALLTLKRALLNIRFPAMWSLGITVESTEQAENELQNNNFRYPGGGGHAPGSYYAGGHNNYNFQKATSRFEFLELTIVDFGLTVPKLQPAVSFAQGFALPLKQFCLMQKNCRHLSVPVDDMFALGITFLTLINGPTALRWSSAELETDRVTALRQAWREAAAQLLNFDGASILLNGAQQLDAEGLRNLEQEQFVFGGINAGGGLQQHQSSAMQHLQQNAERMLVANQRASAQVSSTEKVKQQHLLLVRQMEMVPKREQILASTGGGPQQGSSRSTSSSTSASSNHGSPGIFLLKEKLLPHLFLDRVENGDSTFHELSNIALRFADTMLAFKHPPLSEHNREEASFTILQRNWLLLVEVVHLYWLQFTTLWDHVPALAICLLIFLVFFLLSIYTLLLLLGWYMLSGRLLKQYSDEEMEFTNTSSSPVSEDEHSCTLEIRTYDERNRNTSSGRSPV
ncbi:unnamed protein product [Amoebophrya sp. A120]|nr:unnamed protein product [Amoebophrya sp. A120]|eukprot:GSA120T00018835001.1